MDTPQQETNANTRHTIINNKVYVDTAFINRVHHVEAVKKLFNNPTLEHYGFGDFGLVYRRADGTKSSIDFHRCDGQVSWLGMSGRPHLVTGDEVEIAEMIAAFDGP